MSLLVDLLIKSGCKTRDEITNRKKQFERKEALAKVARSLSIGKFIKLGTGEEKQSADKEPKVLAETFEALVGAIYIDAGYNNVKKVIAKWFKSSIKKLKI